MTKFESKQDFSEEESGIYEYSEKEVQETKQKLGKLSFGERIVLYNLDTIDPPPDGTFVDIYRLGDRNAPDAQKESHTQNAWFVGFDDEWVFVKFGDKPENKDDYNGSVKLSKCRCEF